jgi:hypothetical protein
LIDPENPVTQARDLRLLLATIDGDEQRADQVLDEEPKDMSPRLRAVKNDAREIVSRLEAQHGSADAARDALQTPLLRIHEEQEEHRDPIGYIWFATKFDEAGDDDPGGGSAS